MADLQEKKSSESPETNKSKSAVQNIGAATEQTSNTGADAFRQSGHAAAQATQRSSEAASTAIRQMSEAGETHTRRSVEIFAEGQQRLMQHAAQRMEETGRKVAEAVEGTAQDLRTLMTLPNIVGGNFGELQKSMSGLVEGVMHSNIKAAEELFRVTDPSAVFQIHRRFMHNYIDALMQGSATIVRSMRTAADRSLEPLEHQFAQFRNGETREGRIAAE